MLDDANPGVRERAGQMVEDMSEEMAGPIGELLLRTTDAHRVVLLANDIVRKDDPGLVPYLERAALQADRPLAHRLLLAETHARLRSRTRQPVGPPVLEPIYREAAERQAAGDPDILIVLASEIPWGPPPLLLLAIADAAEADRVQAPDLEAWLSDRPPFSALLKAAAPEAQSHAGTFAIVVEPVSSRYADASTVERLDAHLPRWFPEPPNPDQE